jgi:tetratricopeptide (TPR) repeat protein
LEAQSETATAVRNGLIGATLILGVAGLAGYSTWRDAPAFGEGSLSAGAGAAGALGTSREDLADRISAMDARLAARPDDTAAAVLLADTLMRQARVISDGSLTVRAEQVLKAALLDNPAHYEARRMLGAVYLSQHRFRDAIAAAEQARDLRPEDAWNYGAVGDGYVELGEYEKAFDAFDAMVQMRPGAAAYARVAYARELRGDLKGALEAMTMAAEATSPHDPESQAWHQAQLGNLHFQMGELAAARLEYERAAFLFPGHPYAMTGLARVTAAQGDDTAALAAYKTLLEAAPTPELAAAVGDLFAAEDNGQEAERYYLLAEQLERDGWKVEQPQPGALARFLAERDRNLETAVTLAEEAAAERRDIFTEDALAWAYFKVGRIDDARKASERAMRTGTSDRRILYHAAAISKAAGDLERARELAARAVSGHPRFDVLEGPAAEVLMASLGR